MASSTKDQAPTKKAAASPSSSKTKKREFVRVEELDPNRQLPHTNEYLDEKLRREAEIQRAKVEGREPDLDNPPAAGGTSLVAVGKVFKHPRNSLNPNNAKTVKL